VVSASLVVEVISDLEKRLFPVLAWFSDVWHGVCSPVFFGNVA
jgi:hypothetical protein